MNKPKATRLGLCMALTVVAVFGAFASSAFASITTEASTVYGSTVPGSHSDYTIIQKFTYDGNGTEPQPGTTDLKKWIVDSPAGLVGNPNAVPYADRCTPAQFDPIGGLSPYANSNCPAASKVGEAKVYVVTDAVSNEVPAGSPVGILQGDIYILQSSPEVPTTLATRFTSTIYQAGVCASLPGAPAAPCNIYPKTKSILAPVTNRSAANNGDTDFRIRTVPTEYNTPPQTYGPTGAPYPHPWFNAGATDLHIMQIDQKLYGMVNGVPFLTMPSRCDSWDSYSYAIPTNAGDGNLAMDPNNPGDNTYVKSAVDSVTPDCATRPYFNTNAAATLSTGERGAYPGLTVTVADPAPSGHDQTKTMVTTLPAATSVNVNALNNVCSDANRLADTCPAASQVGTASIKTPLISAGLTGRVYMTQGSTPGLPFLAIYVDGAVQFRLDATTRFVGPAFNQIETTLTNLPQTPFTEFTVNIHGGNSASSLLFNRSCPTDGSAPDRGTTGFSLAGYAGGYRRNTSVNSWAGCFGISNPSKIQNCVTQGKQLKVTPKGILAKSDVAKVTLMTGTKKTNVRNRATDRKATFRFKLSIKKSKYKKNKKYYYGYKVYYKDGNTVKSKTNTFKVCKTR